MTCTNHKCTRIIPLVITRLFSPNCPLVVAVQCASRQGHTHAMRRMCVRVVHAYTQHTCPRLARIFSCTRAYTCHHNDTLQFRAGAPLALREDPTSRRRPSSSSLLPSLGRRLRTHLSRSVSGNTLSSASRRAIKFRSNLFQRSTGIAKIFGFS